MIRVGELASGRAGDKGDVLDLTLVARDDAAYALLAQALDEATVREHLNRVVPGPVRRYELPGLRALKFVLPEALPGGVYASLRPGLHWQKAAIWLLLDMNLEAERPPAATAVTPGPAGPPEPGPSTSARQG